MASLENQVYAIQVINTDWHELKPKSQCVEYFSTKTCRERKNDLQRATGFEPATTSLGS